MFTLYITFTFNIREYNRCYQSCYQKGMIAYHLMAGTTTFKHTNMVMGLLDHTKFHTASFPMLLYHYRKKIYFQDLASRLYGYDWLLGCFSSSNRPLKLQPNGCLPYTYLKLMTLLMRLGELHRVGTITKSQLHVRLRSGL